MSCAWSRTRTSITARQENRSDRIQSICLMMMFHCVILHDNSAPGASPTALAPMNPRCCCRYPLPQHQAASSGRTCGSECREPSAALAPAVTPWTARLQGRCFWRPMVSDAIAPRFFPTSCIRGSISAELPDMNMKTASGNGMVAASASRDRGTGNQETDEFLRYICTFDGNSLKSSAKLHDRGCHGKRIAKLYTRIIISRGR